MNHPKTLTEISTPWMAELLRSAGVSAKLSEAKVEPLGEGYGLLSGQARARLKYEEDAAGAPASVVIKMPSTAPESVAFVESTHAFEREIRFYREVAPSTRIRVPRTYGTVLEPGQGIYILVMEDLSGMKLGDQVNGLTMAQVLAGARTIAPLHAQWWRGNERGQLPWVPPVEEQERLLNLIPAHIRATWPAFLADFGNQLPPGAVALGERIMAKLESIFAASHVGPRTLVHFDYRADNLFFDDLAKPDPIIVIDWQLAMWGLGAYDLARLAGGSLPPEQRRDHHREIVNTWHQGLVAGGVTGYTADEAWHDYRLCMILTALNPVLVHDLFKTGGKRGLALGAAMSRRLFGGLLECEAEAVVP